MTARYVALGDSMSIDMYAGGPGRGAASLLHRNRDGDFPGWSGRDLATAGFTAQILAGDGATSADVRYEQLPCITTPPTVVTVTMGGNDLIGAYGDTDAGYVAIDEVIVAGSHILSTLRAAGDCHVVLTTVYDPSDGTGHIPGAAWKPWPQLPAVLNELNAALGRLAEQYDALLAYPFRPVIDQAV
ncbi:MAG TPA: GDSL-type esterase/lipase family protein, partial [Micromonosporaceae bacterium]|nr:GDSL-type esterase/lipase family protein [Micromonosporaceae bacterium]